MLLTVTSVFSKKFLRLGLSKALFMVFVMNHYGVASMERSSPLAVTVSIDSEKNESAEFNATCFLSPLTEKHRWHDKTHTIRSAEFGTEAEIDTYFRRTKNGWEDSSKWQIKSEPVRQQLDALHPAIWTLLVVSLVLLVLFGCSTQSEIDRLFNDLNRFFGRGESGP